MADLSTIDLVALIEQHAHVRFGTKKGRGDKATQKSACPWCGGTDRFAVFVNEVPQRFYCGIHKGAGCQKSGDAITFLRNYPDEGAMTYWQACDTLGVDPGSEYNGPRKRHDEDEDKAPSDAWQERAKAFCADAKAALYLPEWQDKLDWLLNARKLTPAIIDFYGLGYNVANREHSLAKWGLQDQYDEETRVWIPRGFVLPWRIDGQIWKVVIRRLDDDLEYLRSKWRDEGRKDAPAKYVEILGSSQGLYGVNQIKPGDPLVLVEGVFDKLIFSQVVKHRIACVATGSTGHARGPRWVKAVKQANPVLVAFDYDANQAGAKAAKEWRTLVQGAKRLTPWAHDINDMHKQGIDLNVWINTALSLAHPALSTLEADDQDEPTLACDQHLCSDCLNLDLETEAVHSDHDGLMYCNQHWNERKEQQETMTPEQLKSVAERMAELVWPGGCEVEVMHCTPQEYIARRKAELDDEARKPEPTQEDYWTTTRRRLARQGYYEAVKRDTERLMQRARVAS